jgi:hypothetical protein
VLNNEKETFKGEKEEETSRRQEEKKRKKIICTYQIE